jgi:hypothetical protein
VRYNRVMSAITYEAVVKNGHLQLPKSIVLPENARVYIVVTDTEDTDFNVNSQENVTRVLHIRTPHLVNPKDIVHFRMKVD